MNRLLWKLPGLAWVSLVTLWLARRLLRTDVVPRLVQRVHGLTGPASIPSRNSAWQVAEWGTPEWAVSMTDPVLVPAPVV